jgi:hypothetical protein
MLLNIQASVRESVLMPMLRSIVVIPTEFMGLVWGSNIDK